MAEDRQVIMPMLVYDDAPAAIEFLCRAFGFNEQSCFVMPDGRIGHAELSFGGARIALATTWTEGGMASPWSLPAVHSQVYCEVPDVDVHYELAKVEGATIAEAPGEPSHGSRNYRALDIEGHRWVFATPHEQE